MEGPSLVIAYEELQPFIGKKIRIAEGNAKFDGKLSIADFIDQKLVRILTWGKHLILTFKRFSIRIHFLMFGSYRVNQPKTHLHPRLMLSFSRGSKVYFYSCSIRLLEKDPMELYDWSTDLMSKQWSKQEVMKKMTQTPQRRLICDVLMDQSIFTGLGNIMKNETLYRVRLHPESPLKKLTSRKKSKLVDEARKYSFDFYRWKKIFQLKKHWEIMRKKICPKGHPVTRRVTGLGHRLSFFCEICQPLRDKRL